MDNRTIIGASIQGSSHKRTQTECQDSMKKIMRNDGCVILSVADGHGSSNCPYSKSGSQIAVNVFCEMLNKLCDSYSENMNLLLAFLHREGSSQFAKLIDYEWKRRVLLAHKNQKRDIPLDKKGAKDKAKIYQLYGTTLLGVMITKEFIFAFQIGDGDIMYVTKNGVIPFIVSNKLLGTETHSLSSINSWKHSISKTQKDIHENAECSIMLSTDGFANSFANDNDFHNACLEYHNAIKQHGSKTVQKNLGGWLRETSKCGSGDDITLLIYYLCDA